MKKIGLISNDIIQNVIIVASDDPPSKFGRNYEDIPQEAGKGWTRGPGGVFFPPAGPAGPSLAELKAAARETLENLLSRYLRGLQSGIKDPFAFLVRSMAALSNRPALFQAQAAVTGQSAAAIANNALSDFADIEPPLGTIIGHYLAARNAITAASNKQEVAAVIEEMRQRTE